MHSLTHDLVCVPFPYRLCIVHKDGNTVSADYPSEEACFDALQPYYAMGKVKRFEITRPTADIKPEM
jgi:hypothetical protein